MVENDRIGLFRLVGNFCTRQTCIVDIFRFPKGRTVAGESQQNARWRAVEGRGLLFNPRL